MDLLSTAFQQIVKPKKINFTRKKIRFWNRNENVKSNILIRFKVGNRIDRQK